MIVTTKQRGNQNRLNVLLIVFHHDAVNDENLADDDNDLVSVNKSESGKETV